MHVLGGLDSLTKGEAWVDGDPLHNMGDRALTLFRRRKIGFVFQFFNLLPTLTVEENVDLPGELQGMARANVTRQRARLLEEVGLSHRAKHQVHELSGGEMQRAALARALLTNPPVLLADEPTGNLDSQSSERVITLFRKLGQDYGATILMVTHSREVASAADRIVQMRDGRVDDDGLAQPQSPSAWAAPSSL
jgi:putative ABC transport system ATP-binding protein